MGGGNESCSDDGFGGEVELNVLCVTVKTEAMMMVNITKYGKDKQEGTEQ